VDCARAAIAGGFIYLVTDACGVERDGVCDRGHSLGVRLDGKLEWSLQAAPVNLGSDSCGDPVPVDGVLYFGCTDDRVFALR
jgi:outer membrane protein assembly factor BamB